jgi:hypothetical protein
MRTSAGTVAFTVAVAISVLLLATAALALGFFIARPMAVPPLRTLPDNIWWFLYGDAPQGIAFGPLLRIAAAILAAGLALGGIARSRRVFRRDPSPILPLLAVFFFSLSVECLQAGTAYLYATDSSIEAAIVLTRVIYWGRFVGLLALLLAALYCIELKYRRYAVLIGVILVVSFAMAAYMPVDRTVFLAQLTWKLGDEQGIWFVNAVIAILTLAASASVPLVRKSGRSFMITAGFALLLASREALFFSLSPSILGAGLIALAAGIFLSLRAIPSLGNPRKRRAS